MRVRLSLEAQSQWASLQSRSDLRTVCKAVGKCLALMQANLRHPGLHTHQHHGLSKRHGVKVFESYAQNQTPGAWRVFWTYGPESGELTILALTPHP